MRDRCPPAMWPVSCASTPMIWFGVSASISAPALTKMRRPSATKALNDRSLMMTTCTFCWASPADPQDRLRCIRAAAARSPRRGRPAVRFVLRLRGGSAGAGERGGQSRGRSRRAAGVVRHGLIGLFGAGHVRMRLRTVSPRNLLVRPQGGQRSHDQGLIAGRCRRQQSRGNAATAGRVERWSSRA